MNDVNIIKNHIKTGKISEVFLILESKISISTENAKEIFLFLYDYTNSFKNSNTTPEILKLAGTMLKYGINHDKLIIEKTKKTLSQMKLCKEIIKKIKLYNNGTIAGVIINKDIIDKYGVTMYIGDSLMTNLLITISTTSLCFIIIERDNGNYEIFLGSKFDKNNIQIIQNKLGINNDNKIINIKTEDIIKIILDN